jgi:hypothetical protein
MPLVILTIVLVANAVVVSAGQLQGKAHFWADRICSLTDGLCHQPFLLGLSAGIISCAYFFNLLLGKKNN